MRIASSLVTFIFLGVAAAGVIPDSASQSPGITGGSGGKGGHNATMSGVHSHPTGSPTGTPLHTISTGIHSLSPASRRGNVNPTSVHSIHPISRRANPSVSYSHPSGIPTGASGHPAPSVSGHSHSPVSGKAQPTGSRSHRLSGASVHPTPSAGSNGTNTSDVIRSHKPSSPTESTIQIKPTTTTA